MALLMDCQYAKTVLVPFRLGASGRNKLLLQEVCHMTLLSPDILVPMGPSWKELPTQPLSPCFILSSLSKDDSRTTGA